MSNFTFICDQGSVENTTTFECDTWDEAVQNFELFLRGAGFVFNEHATLQMVEPEQHDKSYFDTQRNR